MSEDSAEILKKINYTLVRLDDFQDNVLTTLRENHFVMVNIDVDENKMPYALFVREDLTQHQKRKVKEYFVSYLYGDLPNQKLLPADIHPVEWIAEMNRKNGNKPNIFVLQFYKEIYEDLKDVDVLRF